MVEDGTGGSALAVLVLCVVAVSGVIVLPLSVVLILWFVGTSGSSSSKGDLELAAWPPLSWDLIGYVLGWFFIIGFVGCAIAITVIFLRREMNVVKKRPPLTVGLRQLLGVYKQTVKDFSEQY